MIPDNARTLRITAAAGTELAGASFGGTVTRLAAYSSLPTVVYNPKTVIPHAASLRQAFAHCARSLTAATRRCLGRLPVPVWPSILSDRPPVIGMVRSYRTIYLMGREPLNQQHLLQCFSSWHFTTTSSCGFTESFPPLFPTKR